MRWLSLLLLGAHCLNAQNEIFWDSTRYQKFHSHLIVGLYQTYRNFNNEFTPVPGQDTGAFSNNFLAESRLITGIELNYDKFSLSFGIKSAPQKNSEGKGQTTTFNLNFNLGGNIWFMENSFRLFQGFYDSNTQRYDTNLRKAGNYYYQPNFINLLFKSKYLYFTNNKKYSFRSNYVCNYRQLKSGGTWIFSANTNLNYMHNDSSFFPEQTRKFYPGHEKLNGFQVFGLSANAGGAYTLVLWKAFFVHLMFIWGPEQQWRTYEYADRPTSRVSYLSISGDLRGSIGLNFKRAYILWSSLNEFAYYNNSFLMLQNRSICGSFMFGWRFNTKVPKFYRKFQQTRIYSNL